MAWSEPVYSKTRVDDAGATLIDPSASLEDRELALAVINNWRSSHAFPLNTFQMGLRKKSTYVDQEALVAQRIKRLPSIAAKLNRYPNMQLSRVQDIGGCRVVLASVAAVDGVTEAYGGSRFKHDLIRTDDYIRKPKSSGYRGVHLVYRYFSDRKTTYNGLKIEMQLRSRLQHAWATAVETVGTFTQQALKSSQGEEDWLRFFVLMSSELARREGTPGIPGTPDSVRDLRKELKDYVQRQDVINRLRAYGAALQVLEQPAHQTARFFLLELDIPQSQLTLRSYTDSIQATDAYRAVETAIGQTEGRDAVLVSVESVTALRRAYPNYFLDTTAFVIAVTEAVS